MQLVELNESIENHPEMAAVAISYDPVETLAAFATAHDIKYPLLSDVGSRVITEVGLLNDLSVADTQYWGRPASDRHRGLPFPATFVLDSDGLVVSRKFERSHRNRPTTAPILNGSIGLELVGEATAPAIAVRAGVHRRSFFPNQVFPIQVTLAVEPGFHLYVPPVPTGYQALDLSIDGPTGVYWDAPSFPGGNPFTLPGIQERFMVAEGNIELSVPVHIDEMVGDASIELNVDYQACDASSCLPPAKLRIPLHLIARPKM